MLFSSPFAVLAFFFITINTAFAETEYRYKQDLSTEKIYDVERSAWDPRERISEGWDFSLPDWVEPSVRGWTRYGTSTKPKFVGQRVLPIDAYWKDIEPEPGKFNWSDLRQEILEVGRKGFGVELHIKGALWEIRYLKGGTFEKKPKWDIREGTAPRWLRSKFKIGLIEEKPMDAGKRPFQIVNMNIFHSDYHRRYQMMLESLAASGIPQMDELGVVYIHGKSRSKGEEGELPTKGPNADLFNERIDSWVAAFSSKVYKLVFTGSWGAIADHAYSLGVGQRSGFVEQYLGSVENEGVCQSLDPEGYLVTLEDCAPIKDNRAWGDENEEYGSEWVSRFGPVESFPHRYRESMLRVLQMRRNFLWTPGYTFDPDLASYVALSLGKTIEDTPDAWTYLRESYIENKQGRKVAVKNFERWLYQRDRDGARTLATARVDIAEEMKDHHPKAKYDYIARRTDFKNGQNAIVFAVDDRFLFEGPHSVTVKVTYHDVRKGNWKIEIPSVSESCVEEVQNRNSKQIKTLTLNCADALFHGSGMDEDFRIEASGDDAFITMVRVIRNSFN